MDVSRSVGVLQRVAAGLRVIAWLVLALFLAGAANIAQKLSFVPFMSDAQTAVTTTAEKLVPFAAGATGILALVSGVVAWALLLAVAEVLMVIVAIESHTRRAADAVAPAPAPAEERVGAA